MWVALILLSVIVNSKAGRILVVVPTPSYSHQVVFRPLTEELAKRGHKVVFITTDPVYKNKDGPENLIEVDIREVSYTRWKASFLNNESFGMKKDLFKTIELFLKEFSNVFEVQLKTDAVQEIISKDSFDLVIVEASVRPALIFSHIFKAPLIQISTSGPMLNSNDIAGAPSHIIFYPGTTHQRLYNLTKWEMIDETLKHWQIDKVFSDLESVEDTMLRKLFGKDIPSLQDLSKNVEMIFYNVYPIWSDNQPVPTNVGYIGGIHVPSKKELPKDLKTYLDSSHNGVVYVSFGNNVKPSKLPKDKVDILTEVFSELPYNVLWRWDAEISKKAPNIKRVEWVPQSDLLRHPNVKLFIQQGGINSAQESITAGVPLIGIPMIADQWYTSEKYEYFRIGKKILLDTLTKEEFKAAIMEIVEDKSFRENVIKLNRTLNDQPEGALQRAVWWSEYVLRHGGAKHLRAAGANLSFVHYYEVELLIEILILILCIKAAFLSFVYYVCKFLGKLITKKLKKS